MKPFIEQPDIDRCRELMRPLIQSDAHATDFAEAWIVEHDWKVVPVEDVGHFNPEQRTRISSILRGYGVKRCVAVATEPLGDKPSCFELQPTEEDLDLFNQECGLFRFMLTSEDRSWAISCTESYNLFAAKPDLLVALLGAPIEQARGEFLGFVSTPSIDPLGLLQEMALRYGVL